MKISKFGYSFLAIFLAFGILFVSISRAGMEIAAQESNENNVRNNPIEFTIFHDDGSTQPVVYKVPEVSTLPNNPFYGFKKVRDYLWLMFSQGNLNKSKVGLLLADKKIAEVQMLIKDDNSKLALEASSEAIDKLKYADKTISAVSDNETETQQIKLTIYQAGIAYEQVIKQLDGTFEMDRQKYNKIISDIDQFNEQKRQEQENLENQ